MVETRRLPLVLVPDVADETEDALEVRVIPITFITREAGLDGGGFFTGLMVSASAYGGGASSSTLDPP